MDKMMGVSNQLLNLLYPPVCISCHDTVDTPNSLCSTCWTSISWLSQPACEICYFPFEYATPNSTICASCIANPPLYDKARSVFLYDEHSRKLITSFKYGDKTHTAKTYAQWMTKTGMELLNESDFICPVPMHWKRLFLRKYNQAALLTRHISKQHLTPALYFLLQKKQHNVPQASLTKKQRLHNTKGVFTFNPRYTHLVNGKTIALIDDVTTTNATVNECAKLLKKNGVARVNVLTLGKTLEN